MLHNIDIKNEQITALKKNNNKKKPHVKYKPENIKFKFFNDLGIYF